MIQPATGGPKSAGIAQIDESCPSAVPILDRSLMLFAMQGTMREISPPLAVKRRRRRKRKSKGKRAVVSVNPVQGWQFHVSARTHQGHRNHQ